MDKKALVIASMASMLDNFNRSNIDILCNLGYKVTIAANFKDEDSSSREKILDFKNEMQEKGVEVRHICFSRSVSKVRKQIKSYKQVVQLTKENFELVHCNSPICAALTRIAFRKSKAKVFYTAHGFHFFKGAPLKNWLFYYPVEKICSQWTDTLITINKEDYSLANKKFNARRIVYIPGVGVDIAKYADLTVNKRDKRREIGVPEDAFVLLSVGELNKNKNHQLVIEAIKNLNKDIYYVIAGEGEERTNLENLAFKYEVNLRLLGFRTDVNELNKMADCFVLPSQREGLNVSMIQAMSAGLPCIAAKIRGNVDLITDKNGILCNSLSSADFQNAISYYYCNQKCALIEYNKNIVKDLDISVIKKKMVALYSDMNLMNN